MHVGSVDQLWRYPVKSMAGERLDDALVRTGSGIDGDRAFAVIDAETGTVASAKHPRKWACLLGHHATFAGAHRVRLRLADGSELQSSDPDVDAKLSAVVGRPVRLSATPPAQATYEELGASGDATAEPLAVGAGSGTFFDFAPIHFITTSTLARLAELAPQSQFDRARFRPNLVVDTGQTGGFIENEWNGRVVAIGDEVKLYVMFTCPRCVMTTLAQPGLPHDPAVLRTAAEHNTQLFPLLRKRLATVGMYASVLAGGAIRAGDRVRVEDGSLRLKAGAYLHAVKRAIRRS
jgi:uncharacterized protein